jgi:hypothetical protein
VEVIVMFTFRNVVAVALFLFGTTFLWMTASFAGRTEPPQGMAWALENVLALLAIVLFSAAAWAVYKDLSWWEPAALAGGVLGVVAVVPYVVAVSGLGAFADMGVEINLGMHVVGSAAVIAMVAIPGVHDWIARSL